MLPPRRCGLATGRCSVPHELLHDRGARGAEHAPHGRIGSRSMNEPAASEDGHAPLTGLRVVAVEQFGAGPFGTLLLADLGAEVIKIEDPASGGDVGRGVPPGAEEGSSLYFEAFNRGKRSLALDLTNPGARKVFSHLVATADAVFNNLRGDLPDRLGLTYAALSEINPAIVCVSLSA